MPFRDQGPFTQQPRKIKGRDYHSQQRETDWAEARRIRQHLRPVETQQGVANQLGLSRQAVEQIELRALAKVAHAFRRMKGDEF